MCITGPFPLGQRVYSEGVPAPVYPGVLTFREITVGKLPYVPGIGNVNSYEAQAAL